MDKHRGPNVSTMWSSRQVGLSPLFFHIYRFLITSYCGWLRNPAPVDKWFTPLFLGFQPSFWWCRISSIHSSTWWYIPSNTINQPTCTWIFWWYVMVLFFYMIVPSTIKYHQIPPNTIKYHNHQQYLSYITSIDIYTYI